MRIAALAVLSLLAFLAPVVPAAAGPYTLNWGSQYNPGTACDKVGSPVINVVETVQNTVDSGIGGNYWAFDSFTRQIQVWPQGDGTYCATVTYQGKFDAVAGQASPGGGVGNVLDGDEDGVFQGGYDATIDGTLLAEPAWPMRGNVGTHDYGCNIIGACPGYVSWLEQYFEAGYLFSYDAWGWIYRAGKHGVWVNSSDGNAGDIQ